MDRQTHGKTDRQTHGKTDRQTECSKLYMLIIAGYEGFSDLNAFFGNSQTLLHVKS